MEILDLIELTINIDFFLFEVHLSVDNDDELENQKSKSDKCETENLTTSVGNNESVLDIFSAFFCCSNVSVHGDSHSDVASQDGGESTDNESCSGVAGTEVWFNSEEK